MNNPNNKPYFGVRIGGEVTCPGKILTYDTYVSAFKNGGGAELSAIYNFPIVANLYLEPGLRLFKESYSLKDEFVKALQDDIVFNSLSIRKFGMRIPVMIGYHFDFTDDIKVSVFTGPELEIGFTAKECIEGNNIELSHSLYGEDGGLHRVSLLWETGAGISYKNFFFSVSESSGVTNALSHTNATFFENHVTFRLGYNF